MNRTDPSLPQRSQLCDNKPSPACGHDHPETLTVTIPKKIVHDWQLHAGQIVEFSTLVEGQGVFMKIKKVSI